MWCADNIYKCSDDTVLEKMGSGSTELKKQGPLQGLAFFMGNTNASKIALNFFFKSPYRGGNVGGLGDSCHHGHALRAVGKHLVDIGR